MRQLQTLKVLSGDEAELRHQDAAVGLCPRCWRTCPSGMGRRGFVDRLLSIRQERRWNGPGQKQPTPIQNSLGVKWKGKDEWIITHTHTSTQRHRHTHTHASMNMYIKTQLSLSIHGALAAGHTHLQIPNSVDALATYIKWRGICFGTSICLFQLQYGVFVPKSKSLASRTNCTS